MTGDIINLKIIEFYKLLHLVIHFLLLSMDYEDIIKLEEQSPAYSTGNNSPVLKQYLASFYDNDSELFKRDFCEQFHVSQFISFEQVIFFIYPRRLIISKTMSISLILLLTISFFVSKDYNLARILIKRFSEKKFLKENISSKDIELKIDNLNYNSLINNSLN